MFAKINIVITRPACDLQNTIEFFAAEWDELTESKILKELHEILLIARPISKSLLMDVTIRAEDPERLETNIRKNILRPSRLNPQKLSAREIEVFNLIVQGYTNKEIASKIFICFETVRSHRKNILQKTGCVNTAMLINYFHNAFQDNSHDLEEITHKGD